MRLTTKGRFAVTAMIDVAMHGTQRPGDAGRRIRSARGSRCRTSSSCSASCAGTAWSRACAARAAAISLARGAETISVADIIVAVDEPIDATQCGGRENCHDDGSAA